MSSRISRFWTGCGFCGVCWRGKWGELYVAVALWLSSNWLTAKGWSSTWLFSLTAFLKLDISFGTTIRERQVTSNRRIMQSFGSLVVLLRTKIKSLLAQILSTVLLQISFLHLTFWFPDFHILSWCSGDAACWKRTMCNTKHQTTQEKRQETVENSLLNLTLLDDLVYVKCYRSSASLLFLIGMLMYNLSWEQWGSGSTRVVSERVWSLSRVELLFSRYDSYDAANSIPHLVFHPFGEERWHHEVSQRGFCTWRTLAVTVWGGSTSNRHRWTQVALSA